MATIATEQHQHTAECTSFLPGHRLHWTQWKHASAVKPIAVESVAQHGHVFEVKVPGRPSMLWRHHNPDELTAALAHAKEPVVASMQWRMLRIDGHWFNCVPADAELTLCI